jgi:hypothetical protein
MAITFVQSKTASGVGPDPVTVTLDAPPTEGNLLVLCHSMAHNQTPATPSGWTADPNGIVGPFGASELLWFRGLMSYKIAAAGESATIQTAGLGPNDEDCATVLEFASTVGTPSLFDPDEASGSGTAIVVGPFTPPAGTACAAIGLVIHSSDGSITPADWTEVADEAFITPDPPLHYVAYEIIDPADGNDYNLAATAADSGAWRGHILTFVSSAPEDTTGGGLVEWDLEFVPERIKEWTITRGASPELTGGSNAGSATIILINHPDDRYNPENAGGDLYGFLRDGPRVWIGVNEDGTVESDPAKDVYGLFAGRITDISILPEGGATVAPFVELVCADPMEWAARQKITLTGWTQRTVPPEPATLPLSSADGLALRILDELNSANGTRHFAKPEDNPALWFRYYAVRRTEGLDGSSSADLDAAADHVTGTSGWRISADGIINQQRASVEPVWFSPLRDVWESDEPLPTVVTGTPYVVWVEFPDFVDDPVVDVVSTGGTLTSTLLPFGRTAKLTLTSSSTNVLSRLAIQGHIAVRGSVASYVKDDTASQADTRGVRAGPDLTGDYLGTITSAQGFAEHIVYRFAGPLYRPTVTVVNWIPEMFTLDLLDRVSVTVDELSITDRVFEIVGLTLHSDLAALDVNDNPVVLHTATYVLQESREQTDPGWFILDDSLLDDTDILAY